MFPSADQVARAVIAAASETGAHPLTVLPEPESVRAERARMYAGMALRKAFPDCPGGAIGRMIGSDHPPFIGIVYSKATKGAFRWFDMAALQRIVAAMGPTPPPAPKPARGRPAGPARALPELAQDPGKGIPRLNAAFNPVIAPRRPKGEPTKGELRDMLRSAVENTAKLPSQN